MPRRTAVHDCKEKSQIRLPGRSTYRLFVIMEMTRERKLLLAVLGTAVLGLIVNAFIPGGGLAGPSVAHAADEQPAKANAQSSSKPAPPTSAAPVNLSHAAGPSLAQRLAQFASDHPAQTDNARDAFTPSKSWLKQAGMIASSPTHQSTGRDAFRHAHHLMAVMAGDQGGAGLAVVDNQPKQVGDTVDGYRHVALHRRSAVFAGPGGRITLELPTDQ